MNSRPIVLAILASWLACLSFGAGVATSAANDDRDVIQTAMLSFFHHEEWHSADWKPKEHVVLRKRFTRSSRPDFAEELKSSIQWSEESIQNCQEQLKKRSLASKTKAAIVRELEQSRHDLAALDEIKKGVSNGAPFSAPQLVQPGSLTWDKRIVLSDNSNRSWSRNRDRSLEESTVYGYPAPPSYSPNGEYAFLDLAVPWSIHSSDVRFLLHRKTDGWTIEVVQSRFYV